MSDTPPSGARGPSSTLRLQVTPEFPLPAVAEVADIAQRLGVGALYLSPILSSTPGSTHGYDVTDPTTIDPQRGGRRGFDEVDEAARAHGLGIVVDVVPNHVAVLTEHTHAWMDLLRHGRGSEFADTFDVDWEAGEGKINLPVLGQPLDEVIDAVCIDGNVIRLHEHVLPLAPGSLESAGVEVEHPERDQVERLLEAQHWRLVHWRDEAARLNYRRFFDITSLGGIRVEDPAVFEWAMGQILDLVRVGSVTGLRIDHPDGLRDPAGFFRRLRQQAPDAWIVVEKILEPGEPRREDWPIDGDVGYVFCNLVLGLFIDPTAEDAFTRLHVDLTGQTDSLHDLIMRSKAHVLDEVLVAERQRIERLLLQAADEFGVPATPAEVAAVVRAFLLALGVYRTYVVGERNEISDGDRAPILAALDEAQSTLEPSQHGLLHLLGEILTLEARGAGTDELIARLQQLSGPVMAKGVEDTVFYRSTRFAALNEVGGDPARFGVDVHRFHAANRARQESWPDAMLLTSSHDTKRSEDVRARLAVLSQIPERWRETVRHWRDGCAPLRSERGPSPSDEYFAWQTALGAWPIGPDRLASYLGKAAKEAKQHTSWRAPEPEYERDLEAYARGLVSHRPFVEPLEDLLHVVRPAGRRVSLVQTVLRSTSPGIPDVYQGCDLWDLSLVDPDNRRPVDWGLRRELLDRLDTGMDLQELATSIDDPDDRGVAKLWLLRACLQLRMERPRAFDHRGEYEPLAAAGAGADGLVAFTRGGEVAVVAETRVVGPRSPDARVTLPDGVWHDVLRRRDVAGGQHAADDLLRELPVAVLSR